ncbi:N-acetyltransferase [Azorhizobium oxalatiphilum]|uniref:N-acetyltransferase n=1 Tax=Azorhizobium oxalatiphilum TaxID=980631 RepID=A0A917C7W8_9HYPH|nr:GNAT family N-acetyltransferase [Azorhizobium oxalatiphilum]GGF76646.1 N-acetyltransferase [Azorhizobium oxalatiphilum]
MSGTVSGVQSVVVRHPVAADEANWRRLWAGYNDFYNADVPDEVTSYTWRRVLDPASDVFGLVAEVDGQLAGMALCVAHEGTWSLSKLCYLEDLFVDPSVRGAGVARAIMDHLVALCEANGWSDLYWHTRDTNAAARRLYDSYVKVDDHVRYRMELNR